MCRSHRHSTKCLLPLVLCYIVRSLCICLDITLYLSSLCHSAVPEQQRVLTELLIVSRNKHAACLSAQSRPQAFYGAVIQAWPGNSCRAPSHSLSLARVLKLSKCHRFVLLLSCHPCAKWHAHFMWVQSVVML